MAIDRTWWNNLVDDDGSGTVGTVWNKAAIKGLLDAVDGLFAQAYWTPIDGSGAGLALTNAYPGTYVRIDKLIWASFNIAWPSTANGAGAVIGGLPVPVAVTHGTAGALGYSTFGDVVDLLPINNSYTFGLYSKTGTALTNAQMSGKGIAGFVTYLTP